MLMSEYGYRLCANNVPAIDEKAFGLDNFGARFSALLTAPATGEYTFYLAADDTAELLLSTDADAANLKKVCEIRRYTKLHDFSPNRGAGKVTLQKGKKYYLVVNFKDAVHGEHITLAWEGPGIKRRIIDNKYFTPVLNRDRQKVLEKTTAAEKRGRELEQTMFTIPPAELTAWLEKLPAAERNMLNSRMQKVLSSLEWYSPAECSKLLHPYVKAARGIKASPSSPVKDSVAKCLLHMENVWLNTLTDKKLAKFGAHRLADSLGTIPKNAKPVKSTQKLNSAGDKWRDELVSLGLYAAPGLPVTVQIPAELAGKGIEVQAGHHFPQKNKALVSMPDTTRYYKLTEEKTTFITPHGGLLLLKVPGAIELKDTPVSINGALKAPRFILGVNTDEEWAELKKAPAPWGELVSEHVVLIVAREDLQKLTNPTEVMTWWNENNRDLEDFYSYYPKVPFRMHAGLYAEEGVSWWPLQWDMPNMAYLLRIDAMKEKNSALFLHEHGHHCDFWEMELSFWAESTTNWGGYYLKSREGKSFDWKDSHDLHMRRLFEPGNESMLEIMQDKWYKVSTKGTHHWSYPITTMMIGYAEEFGWECVKTTIKRIRDTKGEMYQWDFLKGADDDQAKIDRYLIGLSEAAGRDVRPYFAHFKMFPSDGAARHLDSRKLPEWDLTYLVQPEVLTTPQGTALNIPCGAAQLLSFAEGSDIRWKPESANGGTVTRKGDTAVYTPKSGFRGVDVLYYRTSNQYGKNVVKELRITVE